MIKNLFRRIWGQKCYDSKSRSVYYLFTSEIDSSFLKVNISGSSMGVVWMKAAELTPNDVLYHAELDEEQKRYVREIRQNLAGVYDQTQEQWELGFRKDRNINQEIASWWFLSGRFREIKERSILDHEEVKSLFSMMVAIMNNGKQHASNLKYIGEIDKRKLQLIDQYTRPESAQQGDAPEPATIADPASPTSQPPAR